jgi:filamentous hemagglutinin family protein
MAMMPRRRFPDLRGLLLCGTALVATGPALAQAPNARPQGGVVSAGSATIAQDAARTQVNQATDRAVIDWRGFDVGRDHAVRFQQPNSGSMTLNRVNSVDPSRIAGQVTANGGIAIVNQSGVIFAPGARVEAQSVIVSTADIANQRFMAGGRMVFDRPGRADARIVNEGTITAREAGIAALVAPQVANRGVINARLGTVAIAGAETHVIDLYGDGLMSIEITGAVRQRPGDGGALVTNEGVLQADGGRVSLTAAAADGIVQNLVRAGGRISANTDAATGRRGEVVIAGTGGAVIIEGQVEARGLAAGQRGGTVEVVANRVLAAAGARINASGAAGGGEIAFGQTRQGSATPRRAERTGIVQGAELRADATVLGQGGRIVIHSTDTTVMAGTISARGGPQGGDGGFVEVSGERGFRMLGAVDVSAPAGRSGEVLFDPINLRIAETTNGDDQVSDQDIADGTLSFGEPPSVTNAFITPAQIAAVAGDLTLQADTSITVVDPVTKPSGNLTLETGANGNITINADVVVSNGNLALLSPQINLNALASASGFVSIAAPTGGSFTGSVIASGAGRIEAPTLNVGSASEPFLHIRLGGDNRVGTIFDLRATGDAIFRNTASLTINGTVGGGTTGIVTVDVVNGDLIVSGSIQNGNNANGTGIGGDQTLWLRASATGNITIEDGAAARADGLQIAAGGALNFTGEVGGYTGQFLATNSVRLSAGAGGITQTANDGAIGLLAATLNVTTPGSVSLIADNNSVRAIGASTVGGDFRLAAAVLPPVGEAIPNRLALNDVIDVGGTFALSLTGEGMQQGCCSIIRANRFEASAPAGSIFLDGENQIASLGDVTAVSSVVLVNTLSLTVAGTVAVAEPQFGQVTIRVLGGDLIVNGGIQVPGDFGNFDLAATGNVVIGAGAVLTGGLESIGEGASFNSIIAGYDPQAGFANLALPGGITLAGTIASDGLLYLAAGQGGIVQTGGSVTAGSLAFDTTGVLHLGAPNAIGSLVNVNLDTGDTLGTAAGGDVLINNGTADLLVDSVLSGANVEIITRGVLTVPDAPPPTVGGNAGLISAPNGRVSLRVGDLSLPPTTFSSAPRIIGAVVEIAPATTRPVVLPTLISFPVGDPPPIESTTFQIWYSELSLIAASNTLRVGATTIGGVTETTAASVTVLNPLSFAGTLDLRSLGTITQGARANLTVGALTGQAGGAVTLTNAGNSIGFLDDFSAGGGFALTAGAINLRGLLSAPGQLVTLNTSSAVQGTGTGRIEAGELRAAAGGGPITLTGENRLDRLGESSTPGDFTLINAGPQMTIPSGQAVQAGGTGSVTATTGSITVDGTIRAATLSLSAPAGTVTVNGFSAIAFAGGLTLSAQNVTVAGLIAGSTEITVNAAQAASLAGIAQTPELTITSPSISFGGLDASGSDVALLLGGSGSSSGSLSAAGLRVVDGAGVVLTGSIAGNATGSAAVLGRRFAGETQLGDPPPNRFDYLFNDCPIGASSCARPVPPEPPVPPTPPTPPGFDIPVFTVADNPRGVMGELDPAGQPPANPLVQIPALPFLTQSGRDTSEDRELAPPNIRAEDF